MLLTFCVPNVIVELEILQILVLVIEDAWLVKENTQEVALSVPELVIETLLLFEVLKVTEVKVNVPVLVMEV
ncbi:MAG: hypothetical protein V4560_05910 [Bacteroidota bacterium]